MVAVLDLWGLFVDGVFGGFWVAVFGIAILMFIIMGVLGRISIYSTTVYILMFVLAMTLGYGWILVSTLITTLLLFYFFNSWQKALA